MSNEQTKAQEPQSLPPFACRHSPDLAELLQRLKISVAITTYQGGKILLISPKDRDTIGQLPRNFDTPMGMALKGDKLAVALKNEVLVLANDDRLCKDYPNKPEHYDAMFMPRGSYFTGQVAMHDLGWGNEGELYGVNTNFSCLVKMTHDHSFQPIWQPKFISELTPEDRCHLNGMAMYEGKPTYVTALGECDEPKAWSAGRATGGILMEVESGEIITRGLGMPHSPRIHQDRLFVLESANGEVCEIDRKTGKRTVIQKYPGFVRGLSCYGDYLFVGMSKLRSRGSIGGMDPLPIQQTGQPLQAGFKVIHIPTGGTMGELIYAATCEEIYEIQVLPGMQTPNVINHYKDLHQKALSLPDKTYWAQSPEELAPETTEEAPTTVA